MSTKTLICGTLLILTVVLSGCVAPGPGFGIGSIPLPVSPYFQQGYEDVAWEKERGYSDKVVVLGPVSEGEAIASDPPSEDQVIRLLEKSRPVSGGVPFGEITYRNIKGIERHLISDNVDPPRFYPGIGPAQVHHAHYKCIVYFEEVTNVGWPIPHTLRNEDAVEVLYIDKDHFHRVGGPEHIQGGM